MSQDINDNHQEKMQFLVSGAHLYSNLHIDISMIGAGVDVEECWWAGITWWQCSSMLPQ